MRGSPIWPLILALGAAEVSAAEPREASPALGVSPLKGVQAGDRVRIRADLDFAIVDDEALKAPPIADVRRRAGGAMLDWHPLGNGFRVSAGARIERKPSEAVRFARLPLPRVKSVAPAVTVGYAARVGTFDVGVDAGMLFHGAPRERRMSPAMLGLENDVGNYKLRPAVQLSVSRKF